jgi:hypothetical protein
MHKHSWYEAIWDIKCYDKDGKLKWKEKRPNILVDEGEKAIVDTFFRAKASLYFAATNFYVGLYKGTISESTVLTTIPGEPSGNGYARIMCERSSTGFPTLEQHEGDWRVVSKTFSLTASGGSIGPINGAFLGTSSNDTGSLIGAVAMGIERTILSGDTVTFQLRIKIK